MANFTHEQEQAITTHDKNLIVVAGAGSGKTRVLVERYLDLLDKNRDWRLNQLVAITFTREAAFEMRDRVRKELENRVQHPQNDTDRRHWSDLLGQMDSARIDTIHGMCATILRANAAEAHVDPSFDVLEPVEAESILSDIIDAELQRLADDTESDLAILFTEYDMRDIREVLASQSLLAVDLSQMQNDPQQLFKQWQGAWVTDYHDAIHRADERLTDYLNWMPATGYLPEEDKLSPAFMAIADLWQDVVLSDDTERSIEAVNEILSKIDLRGGSAKNWGDKEIVTLAKDVLRAVRDELNELQKQMGNPPAELDQKASEMLVRWLTLLQRVQNAFHQEKARAGYLDFNDLEARTAQLLANKATVRKRYQGAEFKRLLVDEFQDTNQEQWDIVRNLASLDDDVAMFLVGDPKQSIYAFRGADVSVFDAVRHTVRTHSNGLELDLTRSFRSHPGLITAFNRLFEHILTRDDNSPVASYEIQFDQSMEAHRQTFPDPDAQIYAPIELLIQRNQSVRSGGIPSDERRLWEAYEIGLRFNQLIADNAQIHDKESNTLRDFTYGDAAILFQSTTQITVYEQIFKAMKIPFVTLAGRGYYNRQEVWDVLNLLKALHNPADNLSLAVALRSPMFGFSDEMLLALRLLLNDEGKPIPLWDALQVEEIAHLSSSQMMQVQIAQTILQELRALAGRVKISELLRTALARTGYLASLTGLQGGARLRRNVEKLVDIAEQSGKITLGAFSHYLNDLTDREVREGEAMLDTSGAVRLMTVHASKGLEFPVVVLADAGWERRGGGSTPLIYDSMQETLACKVYDDDEGKLVDSFAYRQATYLQQLRDDAERKRLLYVAATRARDCLILSGEMIVDSKNNWRAKGWLGTVTQAIGLESLEGIQHKHSIPYTDHTNIHVLLPDYDAEIIKTLLGSESATQWRKLDIQTEGDKPKLMHDVTVEPEKLLGHIAATQLANIGGYHYTENADAQQFYRTSVRRDILDDSAPRIRDAIRTRDPRVRPRQLGEVVHEALRYWRFPDEHDNIDDILRSYAWQQNITDEAQIVDVVRRAHRMLETFQRSEIYEMITHVKRNNLPYYAELPFIYRTEKRIIHGIIDTLFKHDDIWTIVDYKTSTVRGGIRNIENHARRYHLQLGAYASAVRQEIAGQTPNVFVHYIQYNRTVSVPTAVWESEIQRLENYIGNVIG